VGEHCAGHLTAGGLKVAVVERELTAGECSYYARIPSKTLLRPGEALAGALAAPGAREAVTEAGAAALIVAGLLSVIIFPAAGLSLLRRRAPATEAGEAASATPTAAMPLMTVEDRQLSELGRARAQPV
jgi:hypothetical protein